MTDKKFIADLSKRINVTKNLIERMGKEFPFLVDDSGHVFGWYGLPNGWQALFVSMCCDLKDALGDKKCNYWWIEKVKQDWGRMEICMEIPELTSMFTADDVLTILSITEFYSRLSSATCCTCGHPAEFVTTSWVSPVCKQCAKRLMIGDCLSIDYEEIQKN